jgi:hypothetical protein
MTSNSDDLEEQLRQNLQLRRELGAKAAKAKAAINAEQGGKTYRLGWVLYWAACIVTAFSAALGLLGFFVNPDIISLQAWMVLWPFAIVVWLVGRAIRYFLEGD